MKRNGGVPATVAGWPAAGWPAKDPLWVTYKGTFRVNTKGILYEFNEGANEPRAGAQQTLMKKLAADPVQIHRSCSVELPTLRKKLAQH